MTSLTGSQERRETTINALPSDALDDVVRYFSDRPRHAEWFRYITTEYLATLSRDIGPLTRAAARQICTLSLAVGSDDDSERVRDIFRTLGSHCLELHLAAYAAPPSTPEWLAAYSQWASNVRALSLTVGRDGPDAALLLAPIGASLHHLCVDVDSRVAGRMYKAVAQHCTSLKALDLHVAFRNARGLRAMFNALGGMLEVLTLTVRDALYVDASDGEPLDLAHIGDVCTNLSELSLHGDLRAARGDAEALVVKLGAGLRRLAFPYIGASVAFLARVALNCPNAEVETGMTAPGQRLDDFLHGERADPSATMRVLGTQLAALQLRSGFRRNSTFAEAATMVTNLRSLDVTDLGADAPELFSDIFNMRRHALRELRIAFAKPRSKYPLARVMLALAVVARATGSLSLFAFSGPLLPTGTLDAVVTANKDIETAYVGMRSGPRTPDDDEVRALDKTESVVGVLGAFASACDKLRFLAVEDSSVNPWTKRSIPDAVRRTCRSLRDRRICISVDGEFYLK